MSLASDRIKLVAALCGIMLTGFILLGVVNYNVSQRYIRDELVNSSLPLLRDTIYSEIHADLMQPIHVASVMANDTFLRDWVLEGEKDSTRVIRYLQRIHEEYGFFSSFFVSTASSRYYHFENVLKDVHPDDAHDVWFYDFLASGLTMRLDVDTNEAAGNELTVFINYRVRDTASRTIGVTGVGLRMATLARLFSDYKRLHGKTVFMVDGKGTVQVHPDVSLVRGTSLASMASPEVSAGVLAAKDTPADFEFKGKDGGVYLTSRYIPEIDWYIVVQQAEFDVMASARDNFIRTVAAGAVVTLAVLLVSVMTVNRYQRRLESVTLVDSLTGLPNRRALEQRFNMQYSLLSRGGEVFSLAVLDLNDFKVINDTYGHIVGDRILQELGRLSGEILRKTDMLARWGGDEFMLLVMGGAASANNVVHRFNERLAQTPLVEVNGESLCIRMSCGLTTVLPSDSLDTAYLRADKAMYDAKREQTLECRIGD
ncbi:diguanylate cyclase [Desulfovibrio mangrovi]|uniref:sensor domain-containing diguanylate cyclase n=1 Tax=Desulfovibrio mangrovi TaxID=2976983 RepID=UPI002246618C|nr:sensor domain-containing diguanylate cyclase [Desulfovibrio mangrovi]UZP66299.1 diguanylate cyclase [Desulfovibrio mangrovi]